MHIVHPYVNIDMFVLRFPLLSIYLINLQYVWAQIIIIRILNNRENYLNVIKYTQRQQKMHGGFFAQKSQKVEIMKFRQ